MFPFYEIYCPFESLSHLQREPSGMRWCDHETRLKDIQVMIMQCNFTLVNPTSAMQVPYITQKTQVSLNILISVSSKPFVLYTTQYITW